MDVSREDAERDAQMIPKAFFVTGGKAIGTVSKLNAFDLALKNAGIANCNLVKVSSIIPPNCKETAPKKIPIGMGLCGGQELRRRG